VTALGIIPNFPISEGAKARFKRAENASNSAMQVNMHRRGQVPPITSATTNETPIPPQYYLVVGDDGARMYAPFEETTGDRAYDAAVLANYGAYHASVVHIAGPIYVQPPASDHAIRTTVANSVVIGSPIGPGPGTVEVWIRTSETVGSPTVIGYVISDASNPDPETATKFTLNVDGTLTVGVYDDTDTLQYDDDHPAVVNDGDWHILDVVDTGVIVTLYVDGSVT
jgi:hypothetical protein